MSNVNFDLTDDGLTWMFLSVLVSSAEVASSSSTTSGFLSRVRAMATRCFSPPESFRPRSPTRVL